MTNYKLALIKLFTFLGGLYFVLKFLLPEDNGFIAFKNIHEHVINGFTVVGSMAIGLGIINLVLVHGGRVAYKKSNYFFSAVLLSGLLCMLTVQGIDWYCKELNARQTSKLLLLAEFSKKILEDSKAQIRGVLPRVNRERILKEALEQELIKISRIDRDNSELRDAAVKLHTILNGASDSAEFSGGESLSEESHKQFQSQIATTATLYRDQLEKQHSKRIVSNFAVFLNQGLFVALGSAMFSLLGFYIAAAAYRAFRVRSIEASLMMIAALIVMLGQIPFGIWISPHLPEMRMWLLQVPSAGAARAIEMGAGIAGLVLAIRMWLSLESQSFKS